MSAIDKMLGRLGVVRLKEYGLVLTPEDRVLSIRQTTLDDGTGGRIVGWRDTDLAPAELRPHGAPTVPARRPQFPSAAYPVVPQPAPAKPAIPVAAARPVARPIAPPVVVTPPPVAAAPVVEEDDWEWTIAIARARAAAEWAEEAALVAQVALSDLSDTGTFTQVEPLPMPTMSNVQALPPVTATVPRIQLAPQKEAPRARLTMPPPLGIPTPAHAIPALPRVETRPHVSRTVIPVPTLATTAPRNLAPVVRAPGTPTRHMPHPIPPAQPRRFAKGTGPMLPTTKALSVGDDTTPNLAVGDETVPAIYAVPAASATLPRVVARK